MALIAVSNKSEYRDLSIETTKRVREDIAASEAEVESTFAKELRAAVAEADFGCQKPHVNAILSALLKAKTGESLDKPRSTFPDLCVVKTVSTGNVYAKVGKYLFSCCNGASDYDKHVTRVVATEEEVQDFWSTPYAESVCASIDSVING